MERNELFKLLDMKMQEEQYFLSVFQKDVTFFWSIISAIVAGTIVGLFNAETGGHYLCLLFGPALLFSAAYFMKKTLSLLQNS